MPPVVARDGSVYCLAYVGAPDPTQALVAVSAVGTLAWSRLDPITYPYLGPDGTIVVGRTATGSGGIGIGLSALDQSGLVVRDADLQALRSGGSRGNFNPFAILADGSILGQSDSQIAAVAPAGNVLWRATWPAPTTVPVVGRDGTVYFSSGSVLYAMKGSCGPANSAWPLFGGGSGRGFLTHPDTPLEPCLTGIRWLFDRGFQLSLVGEVGMVYQLESSVDLAAWRFLGMVTNTAPTAFVTDAGATNLTKRFYRARRTVP